MTETNSPKSARPHMPQCVEADRLALVRAACRRLDSSAEAVSLAALAEGSGLTAQGFQRVFARVVGVTPKQYASARRAERLQASLAQGAPVSDALYDAGYGSPSRVYERTDELLGMSPGTLRRGAPGVVIRHAEAESSLGWLLVASTKRGVCMVSLGDSREGLLDALRERFPKAIVEPADDATREWLAEVAAYVESPRPGLDLPLDLEATAFQRRVWTALRGIPLGERASYAEIARRIGQPSAVRAVARACATNDVALVVPCHRVVASDGSMAGYRWGVERKRALLERERAAASRP